MLEKLVKDNTVFAGYRNDKYVDELRSIGAIPFYIDMENPESIKEAAEFIKSETDEIDTLINAAGCVIAGVCETLPVENIRKALKNEGFFKYLQRAGMLNWTLAQKYVVFRPFAWLYQICRFDCAVRTEKSQKSIR